MGLHDETVDNGKATGAERTPLFLPDMFDEDLDDAGSDSDKENVPPIYVPLLTFADRQELGEWLCRLARYHDQLASTLREGIDVILALKKEDTSQSKGKATGRGARWSPTPPSSDILSPLWEPRTIKIPSVTEAGPSRIDPRGENANARPPVPVVEKTMNIAELYRNEKRKADRKAAEAARAKRQRVR